MSISRDTANRDNASTACAVVTYTHSAESYLQQTPETGIGGLVGKTVSLSVRVRTSTANAVKLRLIDSDGIASTDGAFHSGGGTYETLTVSRAINGTSQPYMWCRIVFSASCTAYIDNAMLVVGSVAADYAPLHPADDLARCLRYYERYTSIVGNLTTAQAVLGTAAYGPVAYKVPKAVVPTVTFGGTWNGTQPAGTLTVGAPTAGQISVADFQIGLTGMTGLTAGYACLVTGASGATISIEANP